MRPKAHGKIQPDIFKKALKQFEKEKELQGQNKQNGKRFY